jgi:nucleotide-binding universal stress UspA family protein
MKSILAALDDTPSGKAAIGFALKKARTTGARLSGIAVIDRDFLMPPEPGRIGMIELKARRDAARLAAEQQRVQKVQREFLNSCTASGVDADVAVLQGEPVRSVREVSALHDAVVIGRDSDLHGEASDGSADTVCGLLKATARPLFVVPPAGDARTSTDILIAYDASIPSARTLQIFALLRLANGVKCTVLSVDRSRENAVRAAQEAGSYLSLFGHVPTLTPIASGADPADVAAEFVATEKPGIMVMGAYGHTGLKERLLGSFTTKMLARCAAPLFVYH